MTELSRVAEKRDLIVGWPNINSVETLVERSAGLFIFAATACRYVDGLSTPKKSAVRRLEQILKPASGKSKATDDLDNMYSIVLNGLFVEAEQADEEELQDLVQRYYAVVGSVALIFDNLSVSALTMLHYEDFETEEEEVQEIV